MKIPLFGGSGEDREADNSQQLTQNLYVHNIKTGKSKEALYSTPRLKSFANVGTGPHRGARRYNDLYFTVSGNELYEINRSGAGVSRGTLNTSGGKVGISDNGPDNGKQLIIVDGTNGYIWNTNYSTFSVIKLFSSGTADTNTLNKLEDSGATFQTDGVVAGTPVYNITDGTNGTVSNVDSETVLSIVTSSGTAFDLFPLGTESYEVGDADYPDKATHVDFFDGRFVVNNPAITGQFAISASYNGAKWDALEIATAERSPDKLQGLIVSNRQLWLVGTHTAELWFNAGNLDFPYEPNQSSFSQWGTASPNSIVEVAGLVFWISQNDEGDGLVLMTGGGNPQVISTPEIASEIDGISDISDCYSSVYQYQQHAFVSFTFPLGKKTLVYDILTQRWHTWKTESTGYHRSVGNTFVFGKHLVGDPITGRVYELSFDSGTDNGEKIARIRRTQSIHGEDKAIRHHGIWIDIKEGVGDATTPDPQILLRWKDNN